MLLIWYSWYECSEICVLKYEYVCISACLISYQILVFRMRCCTITSFWKGRFLADLLILKNHWKTYWCTVRYWSLSSFWNAPRTENYMTKLSMLSIVFCLFTIKISTRKSDLFFSKHNLWKKKMTMYSDLLIISVLFARHGNFSKDRFDQVDTTWNDYSERSWITDSPLYIEFNWLD